MSTKFVVCLSSSAKFRRVKIIKSGHTAHNAYGDNEHPSQLHGFLT